MGITVTSLNSMNNKVEVSSRSLEIPLSFVQKQNGHISLRYFPCLWDTTWKRSHSCFRDCFWGCLPNSEWDLTKIIFTTIRWKFLDSKPINSHRFSLTSTLSPMTHLDMVPTLPVPCMKLGTFHIMGHLSPSCESHSVIRGWLGLGWGQQRGLCPFLFLSWDKGKI